MVQQNAVIVLFDDFAVNDIAAFESYFISVRQHSCCHHKNKPYAKSNVKSKKEPFVRMHLISLFIATLFFFSFGYFQFFDYESAAKYYN